MVAIKKTDTILTDVNNKVNNAFICVCRKNDARDTIVDWKNYDVIHWSKYQIKETDMRIKTATFTSPHYFDLTTGQYCVLITSKMHEDFGGIILKVEKTLDGLYEYTCQDFSRSYQSKIDVILNGTVTTHRFLQYLIADFPLTGKITSAMKKNAKRVLSGLRPAYQYDQKYYGSTFNFNPLSEKPCTVLRNVTYIDAIRDLIFGSGAYIDVYFDKYGILHIEPYTKDDFYNTGLILTSPELAPTFKRTFDTTNIVTAVLVSNTDKTKSGTAYQSKKLINLNLAVFFGNVGSTIDNPNESNSSSSGKSSGKTTGKSSTSKSKTDNPYGTKKKVVWLNSDNIKGKSADRKFMEDVAKILRKHGWKTKIVGVGPNTHTEGYMGPKNGIWFCIYGGADAAVFREASGNNSYTNKLKKLGSRTVIGMHGGGDIRKGGKYYKWLPRAHDDNYSPSGFRGLKNPLSVLTKGKVPIMYAGTAKQMAAKFLAGGDNPNAC